jgi:hypothetical protein
MVSQGEAVMFGTVCTAVLALVPPPDFAFLGSSQDGASQPKLLVKEKAYFIHSLLGNSLALLHTSTETGEMKVLAAGRTTGTRSPPMGIDRLYYRQRRIVGVATDKERLYALEWEGTATVLLQGMVGKPLYRTVQYRLLVFSPDKGVQIHALDLKGDSVPKEPPKETADKGPLRLHDDGVTCFGRRFEFKGTKLLKQVPDKKP